MPIQSHPTPHAESAQPSKPSAAPEVVALQAERRRLVLARLRCLDDLDAARAWARWTDSRRGALDALSAGRRLKTIDGGIARLDAQFAQEVQR